MSNDSHPLIPVAQYLRMSTDRQEYSLDNQADAIMKYAAAHGFCVVQTYSDPAVTGVLFRKREGLQNLIADVVQGKAAYKAILVYDVSRWGRFLDTDEGAHYEFLCKSAGVRVHYCAETFLNDDNMSSSIMKSLKRAMAGEYSRELGVKVSDGHKRGALLGYRQGGEAGFGLRRLLLASDGTPKQVLAHGERKSIFTDRIVLIPGPSSEVQCVREIYRMFIRRSMSFTDIARELNRKGAPYRPGSAWSCRAVQQVLTHPKYIGCNVWGRSDQRMYKSPVPKPKSDWAMKPGSFEAIIDEASFRKVEEIVARRFASQPRHKTDQELLDELRAMCEKHGTRTISLLQHKPGASFYSYRKRFGSATEAIKLIGKKTLWGDGWLGNKRRAEAMRSDLMKELVALHPGTMWIKKLGTRVVLCTSEGRQVFVVVSSCCNGYLGQRRWALRTKHTGLGLPILLVRLNSTNDGVLDMHLLNPEKGRWFVFSESDPRLFGFKLDLLSDFDPAWERIADLPPLRSRYRQPSQRRNCRACV